MLNPLSRRAAQLLHTTMREQSISGHTSSSQEYYSHHGFPSEDAINTYTDTAAHDPHIQAQLKRYELAYGELSHHPHTKHQQAKIDAIRMRDLRKQFAEANPSLLVHLKRSMQEHDWKELTKLLVKGSLWSVALYALPYVAGPYFLLRSYMTHHDRERTKRAWGIPRRVPFRFTDPHFTTTWRDVKQAFRGNASTPFHDTHHG